jgi:hypothetical protein
MRKARPVCVSTNVAATLPKSTMCIVRRPTQQPVAEGMEIDSNTPPVLQGRLRFGWQAAGQQPHVAVGGSVGKVNTRAPSGAKDDVTHFLVVGELLLPVGGGVELMAEAFYGQAPGFNGGIGQTAVVTASGAL